MDVSGNINPMYNDEAFLSLEVIWKDDDMLELEVIAANKFFSGLTRTYDTDTHIMWLAKQLVGFPNTNVPIVYEAGEKDSYAFISLKFYPLNVSGLVGVQVQLEQNVPNEYRPEEKSKLVTELVVEPNAIDVFQKHLFTLSEKQEGKAVLSGR
jgi:hypothetical protein